MEKEYLELPLWDTGKGEKERLDFLLKSLTLEEKFSCLGTGCPEIPRLGIPAWSVGGEAAHGVQARHDQHYDQGEPCYTTVFPDPIGMSATWDTELMKEAGEIVGTEARLLFHSGKHRSLSLWAPTVDMGRDPRWGRTEECYGEDPVLTAGLAGAYVRGLQGDHPKYLRTAATLKHFYANNQESGRTFSSSSVNLRNKYEYYLKPFRKIIQESGAEGMMTAYNEINGIPAMLLREEISLAKEWGLGHVVCDGGDVGQTVDFHKYYSRHSETIAEGLKAGIACFTDDITMVREAAREAYEYGMITEEEIDKALYEHFRVMLRLGFFVPEHVQEEEKNPYAFSALEAASRYEAPERKSAVRETARRVTAESVVLLKNENAFFPFSKEKIISGREKLTVVGPLGDAWYRDWYGGLPEFPVTVLEGIGNALGKDVVSFENGLTQVKISLSAGLNGERCYLGIDDEKKLTVVSSKEAAEVFEIEFWERNQITFRSVSNGLFLTMEDDDSIMQSGNITLTAKEAFGWFVREGFRIERQTFTENEWILRSWDEGALAVSVDGEVKKREFLVQSDIRKEFLEADDLLIRFEIQKDGIQEAALAAKGADKVLLVLGAHPMLTCKEEVDREDILLPEYQEKLMEEVFRANPETGLLLVSSVPYDISFAKENLPGILTMAGGSMELGNGAADILFGKESPAGRLSMTWYRSETKLPPMEDYDIIRFGRTYQYFKGDALYPFGYGLGYTDFEYKDLEISGLTFPAVELSEKTMQQEEKNLYRAKGKIKIKNIGAVTADEVLQVYVRKPLSEVKRPEKTLVYFERIKAMKPGEEREIHFQFQAEEFAYFDVISERMLLEEGVYEFMAGASSEDIRIRQEVFLLGEKRGYRNGFHRQKAECFDRAKHYVLRKGHLNLRAVCTKAKEKEVVLEYDKFLLKEKPEKILFDFWQEYPCEIAVDLILPGQEPSVQLLGKVFVPEPFRNEDAEGRKKSRVAGQADGTGAVAAHQSWLTRRREIGFREIALPLEGGSDENSAEKGDRSTGADVLPVGKEFTLRLRFKGKGKLCMFWFA